MGTARDSLAPIALGNLSPEGKRMAFPDFVNEIEPVGRGEGYFSDGTTIQKIIVPTITRWDVLHEDVRELVEQTAETSTAASGDLPWIAAGRPLAGSKSNIKMDLEYVL